ncbi:hypothetical protein BJ508DRAFT_338566 [Ascobolus immersus RN42]|uniref:BTB domain-containing protein n=1 Tax=Ascobolus immersus RN42 TaxID=1160509 RepID=A0A3N4HQS9_ASCIM|nr:hypothetical protein BJ508DRAFT_338566 [Ascobolus immersus RN42]
MPARMFARVKQKLRLIPSVSSFRSQHSTAPAPSEDESNMKQTANVQQNGEANDNLCNKDRDASTPGETIQNDETIGGLPSKESSLDDSTLDCHSRPPSPRNHSANSGMNRPAPALTRTDAIETLFLNPKYSDMTILVGDKLWCCHRSVVCTRSEFFELALRPGFKA